MRADVGLGVARRVPLAGGRNIGQRDGQVVANRFCRPVRCAIVEHESQIILDHPQPLACPIRGCVDRPQQVDAVVCFTPVVLAC